ncbi:MAG: CoA-binding protein [Bacteroidetes bacterium]|nr:MAG: CoA-binding protein [Bacteroidota bacterium]
MKGKKKTLIIGASENPSRYSNIAARMLLEHGYPIELVGLREGNIQGHPIHKEHILFKDIDTVTLYVGPKNQPVYYDYILALNPRRVIFNPGTYNPELKKMLEEKGIITEEACTLVLLSTGQY